jgi:hypothetical protein
MPQLENGYVFSMPMTHGNQLILKLRPKQSHVRLISVFITAVIRKHPARRFLDQNGLMEVWAHVQALLPPGEPESGQSPLRCASGGNSR